jgi:DNA-binding transcriptional MerR regulator
LNVATSKIRFWEQKFDVIKAYRTPKGTRMFTDEDLANFKTIKSFSELGYSLDAIKKKLKNKTSEDDAKTQTINTLNEIKNFLTELKNNL